MIMGWLQCSCRCPTTTFFGSLHTRCVAHASRPAAAAPPAPADGLSYRGRVRSLQDACATLRSHTALLLSDVAAAVAGRGEGPSSEVLAAARRLEQVGRSGLPYLQVLVGEGRLPVSCRLADYRAAVCPPVHALLVKQPTGAPVIGLRPAAGPYPLVPPRSELALANALRLRRPSVSSLPRSLRGQTRTWAPPPEAWRRACMMPRSRPSTSLSPSCSAS
jgi:hypothetical protein